MELHQRIALIVEDEFLIRMILAEALQDVGYGVLEASNVLEAVAVLGKYKVDVLISDVDMPGGLNGLDLARHLRAYDHSVGILVTSGGHHCQDVDLPIGTRFLPKPYRIDDVLAVVSELISRPSTPGRVQSGA